MLIEYVDPDGDFPFYAYERVDAPSWTWVARQMGDNRELYSYEAAARTVEPAKQREERVQRSRQERERAAGPPPRRDDAEKYGIGPEGDATFRADRAAWYYRFTGLHLQGMLVEQNEQFDVVARRFRGYSDGRVTVWARV